MRPRPCAERPGPDCPLHPKSVTSWVPWSYPRPDHARCGLLLGGNAKRATPLSLPHERTPAGAATSQGGSVATTVSPSSGSSRIRTENILVKSQALYPFGANDPCPAPLHPQSCIRNKGRGVTNKPISIIKASHGLLCSRRLGPAAVRGYCRSETRIRTSNILINSQALYR